MISMENNMISLKVLPRIAVENEKFDDNTLIISIVSPGVVHPKIDAKWVFPFHFHDVTEEFFLENRNLVVRPMEFAVAEAIVDVVLRNLDKSKFIIHCEAGISRSPGVALGLAKHIEFTPSKKSLELWFPSHNKHVRECIERALDNKMQGGIA